MSNKTPLYEQHIALGGKMVDFAGWQLPLNYGSQIEEHHSVRQTAGMFDVSHMTVIDLQGERCRDFLLYLVANNVERLHQPGKALYTCMLRIDGGVIDDLIVYYLHEGFFRLVVNASTREKDLVWISSQAKVYGVTVTERDDLAMIAVQGPEAQERVHALLTPVQVTLATELKPFFAAASGELFIAHTGYTGESGYEITLPAAQAEAFWVRLLEQGVQPCGLGARDSLRLEAGMNLYGTDMDETTNPLESGLGWTIGWEPEERDFVGRRALEMSRLIGEMKKVVGLVLLDRGVLRGHQGVMLNGEMVGETTSGGFSPTLGRSIALARVSASVVDRCQVEVRGRALECKVVKPPFVRHGQVCVKID